MANKRRSNDDVLMKSVQDRRLVPHVPDPTGERRYGDRRDDLIHDQNRPQHAGYAGQRYIADFNVRVTIEGQKTIRTQCTDISQTGMQLQLPKGLFHMEIRLGEICKLDFLLLPGVLQEGTENHYRIKARVTRWSPESGTFAVRFLNPLYVTRRHKKEITLTSISVMFMFMVALVILLMRTESVLYFSQNSILYGYSIATAAFLLTRYLFGMLYKPLPVDANYTPSITIIIPCFNEEKWISRTINSCIDQDYPVDKLEIIIVDDGSSEDSVNVIKDTVAKLWNLDERYKTRTRVRVFFQKRNMGKREAMALGIRNTHTELIGFVDSDSFLEPDAVRKLVQPMIDPKMGGVTGRTDVVNTYTNRLTRMQTVRYYISFRILKAAEAYFGAVTCLSGPLSCYRLAAVNEVLDDWINQSYLGRKATFGDDRSLTNFVAKKFRTFYQDTAICKTLVPKDHKIFLRQQMRWKRSWLRESIKASTFMWRKEPLMALSFYMGFLIPLIAPLIVLYNLIYVPIFMRIFPTTFLLGLLMMALMMSFAQLLFRRSNLWIYGVWFVLYYEAILLWQMPYAWVTFWVSEWGTRGTKRKDKQKKP